MLFMNAGRRSTPILILAVLATIAGCRDQIAPTASSRAAPGSGAADIWDGAHGINGNTDVFFLPPMVSNPNGQPGYGDAFQPGLPVAFKIRDMNTGSVIREFSPAAVATSLADQYYQANWDTKADNLDVTHTYRIEAWIASTKIAHADVDLVSSGSQLKNVNTGEFIPLLDGRTLPMKVRVERGWNCKNDASCGSQLVTNTPPAGETYTILTTNDGENAVAFPANWFSPTAAPNGVVVTVEDVTEELSAERGGPGCGLGLTTMVLEQQCIRITTDPVVTVTNPVIVGACLSDNADHRAQLLKIHEGDNPDVRFLRNVPPPIECPEHIGANPFSNPIARYAYAALSGAGRRVQKMLSPKNAYALDLGVGGEIGLGGGFSIITSGVPLSMSLIAGDQQSALIGGVTTVAPQVRLRALHRPSLDIPEGPNDAIVTCAVTGGGGTIGGSASALATHDAESDADGVYTCPPWALGAGTNTLRVSAANVDDVVLLGGVESPFAGSATFTAFGVPTPNIAFTGIEEGETDRFQLTVTNRAEFPNALFVASPELPPCGLNTSASRTWVDIFRDANTTLYGFCALSSSALLNDLWFAAPEGATPASVYVTLTDRKSNQVYTSNTVEIPPLQLTPAANGVFEFTEGAGRPTHLSWQPVQGAITYEIERAYCESWTMPNFGSSCTLWTEYEAATSETTSFDFNFVGAQPGRWRVRASFPGGAVGPWSAYRYFLYTS
jgi:hypothetical protein